MKQKINIWSLLCLLSFYLAACNHSPPAENLVLIQIHDRNGLSETVSSPDRLASHEKIDYLSQQPYKKVIRNFRKEGKTRTILTTYHPNGLIWQLLEAREMRASGSFKEWFPNGTKKIEATVIGGAADLTPSAQESWLFDGPSEVWNESGVLIASIPYEKGALSGTARYYYDNGSLKRETPFVRNSIEGIEVEFWEDGISPKSKTHYHESMKDGSSLAFWPNASLCHEEEYQSGFLKNGRYWNRESEEISNVVDGNGFAAIVENSSLRELREIQNGIPEGVVKIFAPSGQLQTLYHWKNGKKQGEEIQYFPKSPLQPRISLDWDQDIIHGVVKTWYANGQLQSQRDICRNKRSGMSCAWYKNGALMLLEEYENDKLVEGKYYRKKEQTPISTVTHGNGLATIFDEEGVFLHKVIYSKGKAIDPED